jgi:CheY-like chemotaxis protein
MHVRGTLRGTTDILIAEDDPRLRADLRLLLEGHGYRCAEARNGREAVARAWCDPPRCVLLDLGLPGLDGFEVARRLRADPLTRRAHIHCLTGRADPVSREQASRAGCEAFLVKPVDAARLMEVVRAQPVPAQVSSASDLTKAEAEELLGWLEAHGCSWLEVCVREGRFAVRCVCPPGLRLVQDARGKVRLVGP